MYIELQTGEELTVAFAEGGHVHEGPQLVIKYTRRPHEATVYYETDALVPGEPRLRFVLTLTAKENSYGNEK